MTEAGSGHGVKLPPRYLLHPLRPAAAGILRLRYDVHQHHRDRVPRSGPVVLAANHTGLIDGPVLAILAPRPVHAMTKREMFDGRGGVFLRASGQIRLDRFRPDPAAVRQAIAVLEAGRVVGIFPEGTRGSGDLETGFKQGAAYLALATGAPVVPVIMLGTRDPGQGSKSVPGRGTRLDLVYGEPWRVPATSWPRTQARLDEASLALQDHMRETLREALALTGRTLPGPLPPGDKENLIP